MEAKPTGLTSTSRGGNIYIIQAPTEETIKNGDNGIRHITITPQNQCIKKP